MSKMRKETQEALSRTLKDFCEELYMANDGEEGINKFKEYKPDIVISDIQNAK